MRCFSSSASIRRNSCSRCRWSARSRKASDNSAKFAEEVCSSGRDDSSISISNSMDRPLALNQNQPAEMRVSKSPGNDLGIRNVVWFVCVNLEKVFRVDDFHAVWAQVNCFHLASFMGASYNKVEIELNRRGEAAVVTLRINLNA